MCLGHGWSSGFNSVDQNSSNWHQDPSAHWINPPLSSICSFFVFFISSIHFFIHSVDFWKGRGDMSWGMYVCECCWFFFSFPLKKKAVISTVTFADCRVTGSCIFFSAFSLSLPFSFSLWNRSFVCKELKRSGRRIPSSAGNASRAEMLLGKEVGKSQKPSPLSPSAHMTLGPKRAS